MGKKGSWFSAVKKVFSPDSKKDKVYFNYYVHWTRKKNEYYKATPFFDTFLRSSLCNSTVHRNLNILVLFVFKV